MQSMTSYNEQDLSALILASREHDEGAFVEIVNRYTPMIKGVIGSFSSSSLSYDELFSESCVALHRAVCSYRLGQDEVTFGLYAQICVNRQLSDVSRSRTASEQQLSDVDVNSLAVSSGIESRLERQENFRNILRVARGSLSDYEYRVLMLHIQGYKTREIAERMGKDAKSIDNAKNRLFRRLRAALPKGTDDI